MGGQALARCGSPDAVPQVSADVGVLCLSSAARQFVPVGETRRKANRACRLELCCEESAGANSIDKLLEVWTTRCYPVDAHGPGSLLIHFGISRQVRLRQNSAK